MWLTLSSRCDQVTSFSDDAQQGWKSLVVPLIVTLWNGKQIPHTYVLHHDFGGPPIIRPTQPKTQSRTGLDLHQTPCIGLHRPWRPAKNVARLCCKTCRFAQMSHFNNISCLGSSNMPQHAQPYLCLRAATYLTLGCWDWIGVFQIQPTYFKTNLLSIVRTDVLSGK